MTPDHLDAQVCYLLVTPFTESVKTLAAPEPVRLRDAPYFAPVDVDVRPLDATTLHVEGGRVNVRRAVFDELAVVAECTFSLSDALGDESQLRKDLIQLELRRQLLAAQANVGDMYEEYAILLIEELAGTPDEFLARNGQALARFIRSQRDEFSGEEIESTLMSRVRYSERDMTVVDWEGGIIFAPKGDFQSDIDLLKIGNYQLLRYRLLDQTIERNLETVDRHLHEGARRTLFPRRPKSVLRQVVEQRLAVMLDFEKINQGLLLIGDWYTAKLYRIIYDEFYLDEWAAAIKSKLDNLESIIQVIQDNFSFSWSTFLEMVQIAGWLILLLGYFVLFYFDIQAAK
ncbi:hypothetical protein TFLX_02555 [Thermoflexales bacterium]|nr:hypothetical protein TFLX_02555 [Thermoflexales bacterium]